MTGDERTPLTDAEDDSAEDPRGPIHYLPRTEELYIKGGLAFVFSGVSIFVCFYAQPDLDAWMPYETEWKTFMFALCVFLTLPNIYQTSLVLFTFRAVTMLWMVCMWLKAACIKLQCASISRAVSQMDGPNLTSENGLDVWDCLCDSPTKLF